MAQVDADERTGDVDGRRLRRDQNRHAVLDTLVELYREGRYEPSAAEIAERAGISPRSLFRYFDDTDDLARAAVAHHLANARPLLGVDAEPTDPLVARIDELVRRRIALWEAIGPSARVARMRAPVVAVLGDELHKNRAAQRQQIERLFAPELTALGGAAARRVLAAADVLCSFESYDMMRHDQGLPAKELALTLTEALAAILAPGGTH